MSRHVLFQMWEPFRQSLIDSHHFYLQQAEQRLLSQFSDIGAEADKATNDWIAKNKQRFDPEHTDEGDFAERAFDAGVNFYEQLTDMRERTYLSVVAGMFHEWDKQLRDWLVDEIRHWHSGDCVKSAVWTANLGQIGDLMAGLGWQFRCSSYFPVLDACRLVVNIYKHGEGHSLDDLKQKYPEYLNDPFGESDNVFSGVDHLDHTRLRVTDQQLQEFSSAILAFWENVPELILNQDSTAVPGWFEDAMKRDTRRVSRHV